MRIQEVFFHVPLFGVTSVSELLSKRGISAHPTTIMRWMHDGYRMKKNKSEFFRNFS